MKGLRLPFEGSDDLERNYSGMSQDLFVLSVLRGKRHGTYLEIGAWEPQISSNTYLLEKEFGWTGTSIERDPNMVTKFNQQRQNKCIHADALEFHFANLDQGDVIDYLSLDIDPPANTYKALLRIAASGLVFRVITFEHDYYTGLGTEVRRESRKFLTNQGYQLLVPDVSIDGACAEDWYVHPSYTSQRRTAFLRHEPDPSPIDHKQYLFKQET